MDAQEIQRVKDALEIGYDAACEVAQRFHEEMRGYREAEHKQVDADATEVNNCITLVGMWLTERAVSPAESVPISEHPDVVALRRQDHEQACRVTHSLMAERDELRQRAGAAHAEGRRSALEELAELKREKERRDRIVQRAVARLNAVEVEEPSVIGAGFADPALPIEELYPQWLKEKERADRAEAALNEWLDKTQWVQAAVQSNKFSVMYLGHHRADVIRQEFDKLAARQAPDLSGALALWEIVKHEGNFQSMAFPTDAAINAYAKALLSSIAQPLQQEGGKEAMYWNGVPCSHEDLITQLNTYSKCMPTAGRAQWAMREAARLLAKDAPQLSDNLQQASTAQVEPDGNGDYLVEACGDDYANRYHKVRADIGRDAYQRIWNAAIKAYIDNQRT
jgi:hypothetical protein